MRLETSDTNYAGEALFEEVLQKSPHNGYALVNLGNHLGQSGCNLAYQPGAQRGNEFRQDLLQRGGDLLLKGIKTKDPGVIKAKYFYTLGK